MQENYETDVDGFESRTRIDPSMSDLDLETALLRLEEEQQRSEPVSWIAVFVCRFDVTEIRKKLYQKIREINIQLKTQTYLDFLEISV
jgi:hypothetical protein